MLIRTSIYVKLRLRILRPLANAEVSSPSYKKQNGCLLLSVLSVLSANGGCKSSSHEVMTLESCGVGPTVRGSQPLFSGIEAVVLETPPGTDAAQNEVHRYAEIPYRSILTAL